MNIIDSLVYALKHIRRRRLRAWLTVLGIFIGIMTIVSVLSLGDGLKKEVKESLSAFGTDKIFIIPVSISPEKLMSFGRPPSTGKLFERDAKKLQSIPGIKSISKSVYAKVPVTYKNKGVFAMVFGSEASMFQQWRDYLKLEKGRYLRDNDKYAVVLGNDASEKLFGKKKVSLGDYIYIMDTRFKVVGILKKVGTALSHSDDEAIYIPYKTAKKLFNSTLAEDEVSLISVQVHDGVDTKEIVEEIERKIARAHKLPLEEKDFSVLTADFFERTIGSLMDTISLFLLLIGIIASIVSGVGMANTMFMAVIERTREIGTLKAIGAKESTIITMVLLESIILSMTGGVLGLLGGYLIGRLATFLGIGTYLSPELALSSLLFSLFIGFAAGFFPAKRAASLDPSVALRYE